MDPLAFVAGFGAGFIWSELGRRVLGGQAERPLRLAPRHQMVAPVAVADETLDEQWRLRLTQFAYAGNIYGFALARMTEAGVVTRPGWTQYVGLMRRSGVLVVAERATSTWAPGWNYPAFRMALKHRTLALPYPTRQPPAVRLAGKPAQMTQADTAQHSDTE